MVVGYKSLRWVRMLVLAWLHYFLLAGSAVSMAGEEPPAATPPATVPASAEGHDPETSYLHTIGKTVDKAHERIELNVLEQTIHFDDFFGNVTNENLRQSKYELRWRNSLRIEHGWDFNYGGSIRANFVLSKISERLRLVIAGEDEPGPTTQTLPKDPGSPGFDRTTPTTHFANTELRYEVIRKPSLNLFLGAGVRIKLPFEAFVRSRFQYTRHLSDVSLFQFGETFFVKNTDLLGETTEFSFERSFGPDVILRWASAGTASQEIQGLEWGSDLSLIRQLSPRSAITLTGGIYGNTTSSAMVQDYRFLARYRQNFLRDWLFYELEPEISWPRAIDGRYSPTLAITLRLEIVFQGVEPRRDSAAGTSPPTGPGLTGTIGKP